MGFPPSGDLDARTLATMPSARCGVSDLPLSSRRRRRYRLLGSRLCYLPVTWDISTGAVTPHFIDEILPLAFQFSGNLTRLSFHRGPWNGSDIDILMSYQPSDQGCCRNFDLGELAHASSPRSSIRIHFNIEADWHKYRLILVAHHEILHALGVGHSVVEDSLMYPYYHDLGPNETIFTADDLAALHPLYGQFELTKKI